MRIFLTMLFAAMGFASLHPSYVLADTVDITGWGERSETHQPSVAFTPANAQGQFRYLITFAEPGLLRQTTRGSGEQFDFNTREMRTARETLVAQQAAHHQTINNTLGRSLEVTHHYLVTHSGMAAWLTNEEAETVSHLPGVASVEREREYELATYRGPWFIGADTLWNGTNTPDGSTLRGEGMVLGVIDTGIDLDHPSFANDPACNHGQGAIPDKVLSVLDCSATDGGGLCNGSNPVDTHGHGSHVASTAAGNFLDQNALPPPQPPGTATEISGVAPCAHIRAYKGCPGNSCPGSAIVAGMNSILLHGDVDVLNFSISGGNDPWNDGDRIKLDLIDAGVFVAAAAGNTGGSNPDPVAKVNHLGPWVLSVAASSHDGIGGHGLLSVSGPGTPPAGLVEVAASAGSESPVAPELTALPIRHFGEQPPGWEGCTPGEDDGHGNIAPADMEPFPEGFFDGSSALILRGGCAFAAKIANAFEAGAELVIIRNHLPEGILMDTAGQPDVPAYLISMSPGNALQAFVDDHPETVVIDFEPIAGDVLAPFSLRGPTPSPLQHLTKPDITAPGDSIYAAVPEAIVSEGYALNSGTSMATPHAAGSALLVRQAHPDWTEPEVMSALMTTAEKAGLKESLVDAWDADDVGSGRVDLTKAALAGLVMDETTQNYLDADPAEGGDVRTLNTASLRNMDCHGSCTWTRTVRNTLEVPTQWTATGISSPSSLEEGTNQSPPSSEGGPGGMRAKRVNTPAFEITVEPETFQFTGDPGETQELTITATPLENLTIAVAFGEVIFTETGAQAPDQHLTVAIRGRPPQSILEFDPASLEAALGMGQTKTQTLTIANPGQLPLDWNVTETLETHHFNNVIAGDDTIFCNDQPGLIIHDTGIIDRGYGASTSTTDQVLYVDRYTPSVVPAAVPAVCVAIITPASSGETEFEIVVFDDDGPDGAPGTELGMLPVTASGFSQGTGEPVWHSIDISSLDIEVISGSVYIGLRWALDTPNLPYIGVDESPFNPPGVGGGWRWTAPQDTWQLLEEFVPVYRALFVRPVIEIGDVDCTLPAWVSLDATSGIIEPDDAQALDITFDAAGLAPDTYTATLCLESNDPRRPLAAVALTLTVSDLIFRDHFE